MDGFLSEIGLNLPATLVAGALIGWLIRSVFAHSHVKQLNNNWQAQLDDAVRQRNRLIAETGTLRTSIEAQEAVIHQRDMAVGKIRTELESALVKEKLTTRDLFTLRAEREDFKTKIATFQNALASLKRQSDELQTEFVKSGDFYKKELTKAFEKRKALEDKIENSKAEHESFSNLLHASRSEYESVNKMLAAAKTRLEGLDLLEQNVIELEAENAQLKHDAAITRQENEALKRDVIEQEELKAQNNELAQALKSMEKQERDNLQEIIGIGKVFEHTLHELGIFSFRQIASFDVSEIARINAEHRDFRGRMEQDDWIGQARDLLFKKYGST